MVLEVEAGGILQNGRSNGQPRNTDEAESVTLSHPAGGMPPTPVSVPAWFSAVDALCPSLLHRLVSIVPLRGKGDLRAMVGDRVRLRNARRTFAAMSATNRRMRSNRISRNLRAGKAGHWGGRAHGTSDHLTQGTDREHGHRDRQQEIAGPMRRSGTVRDLRSALRAGSAGANRSCSSVRRSNCRSTR